MPRSRNLRITTAPRAPAAARPRLERSANLIDPSIVESLPRPDLQALFDLRQKPGYYNAQAKAALLRRAKAAPQDELFVDFSREACHIELRAGGAELLAGAWTFEASAGANSLTPTGPWQESCWETDETYDCLEIELPLTGGWRLERQMFLARNDRFLLLADALLAPPGDIERSELHYSSKLALESQAVFAPAVETREGWVETKQRRKVSVVPLALAEWRAEFCHAELASGGGQLSLEQKALGRSLFAPLWIDLDPRRLRKPLTWRRITVAESLAIVPRDIATAYRVQAGREQWLIYRSLAQRGNRTFLGHNTHYEFVCRRFLATGETEAIIEIE